MTRRELLIALVAFVNAPYAAVARTPSRHPVVGMLWTHVPATDPDLDGYRTYFRELGYEEGRNFTLRVVSAEGRLDQLPALANDLISGGADVIITTNDVSTRAAQRATTKIPIVMVGLGSDPVSLGFVHDLRRPEGNITGTYSFVHGLEKQAPGDSQKGSHTTRFESGHPKVPAVWGQRAARPSKEPVQL